MATNKVNKIANSSYKVITLPEHRKSKHKSEHGKYRRLSKWKTPKDTVAQINNVTAYQVDRCRLNESSVYDRQ